MLVTNLPTHKGEYEIIDIVSGVAAEYASVLPYVDIRVINEKYRNNEKENLHQVTYKLRNKAIGEMIKYAEKINANVIINCQFNFLKSENNLVMIATGTAIRTIQE